MNVRLLLFSALAALLPVLCLAQSEVDREALEAMDHAVRQTVIETETDILGIGSWTSGRNYKGPLSGGKSDHDMRVLLMGETDPEVCLSKWKQARRNLVENLGRFEQGVRLESGKTITLTRSQIDKLIASTNVYPPNQIAFKFKGPQDALDYFKTTGVSPALNGEIPDGMFGPGMPAYTQGYEEQAGRHYRRSTVVVRGEDGRFKVTTRVVKTETGLTHLEEGFQKFTVLGEASNARQWGDLVLEDLNIGDAVERMKKVSKHAERLRTSVNKARSLSRIGSRAEWLDRLVNGEITDPSEIRSLMARARYESDLLADHALSSSFRRRQLIKAVLSPVAASDARLSTVFWETMRKGGGKVAVHSLIAAMQLYSLHARSMNLAGITDPDKLNAALPNEVVAGITELLAFAPGGLVPGLMSALGEAVLKSAREGSYLFAALSQDCFDLMTGIHSVSGREDLAKGVAFERLARLCADTPDGRDRLTSLIFLQAYQASHRHTPEGWVPDENIKDTLLIKCMDRVIELWLERRLFMIDDLNQHFSQWVDVAAANVSLLRVEPAEEPIVLKNVAGVPVARMVTVTGGPSLEPDAIRPAYDAMRRAFQDLEEGREVLTLSESWTLTIDGRIVADSTDPEGIRHKATISRPGACKLGLLHEYRLTAAFESDDLARASPWSDTTGREGYTKIFGSRTTREIQVVLETDLHTPEPGGKETASPSTTSGGVSPEPAIRDPAPVGSAGSSKDSKGGMDIDPGLFGEFCTVWRRWLEACFLERQWRPTVTLTEHGDLKDGHYRFSFTYVYAEGPRKGEVFDGGTRYYSNPADIRRDLEDLKLRLSGN